MSIEVMRQALEALESFAPHNGVYWRNLHKEDAEIANVITALRAAIEQAEKPVAWQGVHDHTDLYYRKPPQADVRPLYTTPPAAPVQEPVAWVYQEGLEALKSGRPWTAYGSNGGGRIPLYLNDAVAPRAEPRESGSGAGFESLPASPKWQGLTDDEIVLICGECAASHADDISYARAIEAKLKTKNS